MANPKHHRQVLAAFWGRLGERDEAQLGPFGTTADKANPWARQLENDLEECAKLDGWRELLAETRAPSGKISIHMFFEEDVVERFCMLDVSQLGQAGLTREVPPPGWVPMDLLPIQTQEQEQEQEQEEEFKCPECEAAFGSLRACRAHSRFLHGHRKLIHLCTLTNQRLCCASIFASRDIAARHAENPYLRSACRADGSWWPYDMQPMDRTGCPVCCSSSRSQTACFSIAALPPATARHGPEHRFRLR